MSSQMVQLQVNGQPQSCNVGLSLSAFLHQTGINPRMVAVEYNGEILHRQFWEQTVIQHGDRLEIVTIVGGG